MAIRTVSIRRDDSPSNVNPKFHKPDGTVIPYWSSEIGNTLRSEYYITPEVSEWHLLCAAWDHKPLPPGYILEKDETTHVGRVMHVHTSEERIMSDVWENVTRATVWSPETIGQPEWKFGPEQKTAVISVHVHTTGNYLTRGEATVDADPAIIAAWKEQCEVARKKYEQERAEAMARAERAHVASGKIVRVNRGRKVPQGTTGKVFWIGDSAYGQKVGIATTPRKCQKPGRNGRMFDSYVDVVFVALANVDVVGSESTEAMDAALDAWENA